MGKTDKKANGNGTSRPAGQGRLLRAAGAAAAGAQRRGALAAAHRQAPAGAVRGPRHRRQGRRHRGHRRHAEPAPVPRRGAGQAQRARAHAVVLPALRAAPAGGRRDRAVRPQLVQPRRRRARDGLLHRRAGRGLPDSRRRCSRSCWSTTASCCSSTGSRWTRRSRKSASPSALDDPLKRWKLSPIDLHGAREVRRLHGRRATRCSRPRTPKHAPWTLVDFNDQRRGRLTLIRHLLDAIPDTQVPETRSSFRRSGTRR